jgi:hypothetical protein
MKKRPKRKRPAKEIKPPKPRFRFDARLGEDGELDEGSITPNPRRYSFQNLAGGRSTCLLIANVVGYRARFDFLGFDPEVPEGRQPKFFQVDADYPIEDKEGDIDFDGGDNDDDSSIMRTSHRKYRTRAEAQQAFEAAVNKIKEYFNARGETAISPVWYTVGPWDWMQDAPESIREEQYLLVREGKLALKEAQEMGRRVWYK